MPDSFFSTRIIAPGYRRHYIIRSEKSYDVGAWKCGGKKSIRVNSWLANQACRLQFASRLPLQSTVDHPAPSSAAEFFNRRLCACVDVCVRPCSCTCWSESALFALIRRVEGMMGAFLLVDITWHDITRDKLFNKM